MFGPCRRGQGVAGDRNIQNRISASFRGVLLVALSVHVCAVLQQNIARSGTAFLSGEVKGCEAAADAVMEQRATAIFIAIFQHHSEGYYFLSLAFTSAPFFSRTSHVAALPF